MLIGSMQVLQGHCPLVFQRHEVMSDDAVVAQSIFGIFFSPHDPKALGGQGSSSSAPKGDNVRSLAHELFCLVRRRGEEKRPFKGGPHVEDILPHPARSLSHSYAPTTLWRKFPIPTMHHMIAYTLACLRKLRD